MKHLKTFCKLLLIIIAFVMAIGIPIESAMARPVVNLTGAGSLEYLTGGSSPFVLRGNSSHFGRYNSYGEVELLPGAEGGLLKAKGSPSFRPRMAICSSGS